MAEVLIALGSNLGDRAGYLRAALARLKVVRVSGFHETAPEEFLEQGWFLNAAAAVETELGPVEFFWRLQGIEHELGRRRVVVNGPRTIDLDILFWGGTVMETAELTVPHPRLHLRRFVLGPLEEIAPEFIHPVLGLSVRRMLAELSPCV